MSISIKRGKTPKPVKAVFYGPEGIGKTTLASLAPEPLFIDTEDGTKFLDVARIDPAPQNWEQFINAIAEVAYSKDLCKTIVIDTADWAEKLAVAQVISYNKVKSIEDISYGKGYTMVGETFKEMLDALDEVAEHGINVIVTAHAIMRKIEQPEERGAYDHWGLKLTKHTAPLLKEWCDCLLFANYKTFVDVDDSGKARASGGKRKLYTNHTPYWDAKNRHGLPEEIDMDYEAIKGIFYTGEPEQDSEVIGRLAQLMTENGVKDSRVRLLAVKKGWLADENERMTDTAAENIINIWDKAVEWLKKG